MADKYRILSIYQRNKGKECIDSMYPEERERVFIINPKEIHVGENVFMECASNYMRSIMTSPVKSVKAKGQRLRFRTANTAYILEELDDND